jgi:hypothetical protein
MDRIDPAEPMDRIDPAEPMLKMEPSVFRMRSFSQGLSRGPRSRLAPMIDTTRSRPACRPCRA